MMTTVDNGGELGGGARKEAAIMAVGVAAAAVAAARAAAARAAARASSQVCSCTLEIKIHER